MNECDIEYPPCECDEPTDNSLPVRKTLTNFLELLCLFWSVNIVSVARLIKNVQQRERAQLRQSRQRVREYDRLACLVGRDNSWIAASVGLLEVEL